MPESRDCHDHIQDSEKCILTNRHFFFSEHPLRKAKTKPKSSNEWAAMRIDIYQLYMLQDLSLPDVMKIMGDEKSFVQSYVYSLSP